MKRDPVLCATACALCFLVAACAAPPVESPMTNVSQVKPIRVSQNVQNQVDILFMVDNSPSMEAMQAELVAKFPTFLGVFDKLAHPTDGSKPQYADLHIGVVTSDYGAGGPGIAGSSCDPSPGGQRGLLQAKGAAADASCAPPSGGMAYITYAFGPNGDTCNLPGGCTPAQLGQTFTCMASVGAKGCGFEHQLESVYAALKNATANNKDFIRENALLAVVFVTNEDDGSAPPGADFYTYYGANAGKLAMYGEYTSYRQTRYGVACGTPPMLTPYAASMGPLSGCEAAPNAGSSMIGQEYDIARYVNLFTMPTGAGGIKADPNDVILVGIDAPEDRVETILAVAGTGNGKPPTPAYQTCASLDPGKCIVALQHSCQNGPQPAFFGDPAVRLNAVIGRANLHQVANICGADPSLPPDYSQALQKVADLISSSLKPGCVPAPLTDVDNPDCVVEDITVNKDGTQTPSSIPSCASAPNVFPCWKATTTPDCAPPRSPQSIAVTIDRNGKAAPPMTTARVECSTKACPAGVPDC